MLVHGNLLVDKDPRTVLSQFFKTNESCLKVSARGNSSFYTLSSNIILWGPLHSGMWFVANAPLLRCSDTFKAVICCGSFLNLTKHWTWKLLLRSTFQVFQGFGFISLCVQQLVECFLILANYKNVLSLTSWIDYHVLTFFAPYVNIRCLRTNVSCFFMHETFLHKFPVPKIRPCLNNIMGADHRISSHEELWIHIFLILLPSSPWWVFCVPY